jgi:hypothetical protein
VGCERPFFRARAADQGDHRTARGAAKGGPKLRWADIYADLIADGHDPDRIGDYTERQLILYHDAALRRDRRRRADRITDTNGAMWGGDEVKRLLKELRK